MAACSTGSLHHIFENTSIPENPSSLIESLSSSWKKIKPLKPPIDHSFTEIFGELHFKESNPNPIFSSSSSSSSSSSPSTNYSSLPKNDNNGGNNKKNEKWGHKRSESMNSESLQLCTEGLGFESFDNIDDLKILEFQDFNYTNSSSNNQGYKGNFSRCGSSKKMEEKKEYYIRGQSSEQYRKGKGYSNGKKFPPPISCIGRSGKPWVCFQSHRENGRFVLKEIRIPTQEFLHACRENGRLRLCLVQPSDQDDDDDVGEEEEEEREEETNVENVNEVEEEEEEEEGKEKEERDEIRDDFGRGDS